MPDEYAVEVSDTADAEADEIFLWINQRTPDAAVNWYRGLLEAYDSLRYFPYRFPALLDRPHVRRMIYGRYWILYFIVEPEPETSDEAKVRILHIHHSARLDSPI